jgi:hypothetical protein
MLWEPASPPQARAKEKARDIRDVMRRQEARKGMTDRYTSAKNNV